MTSVRAVVLGVLLLSLSRLLLPPPVAASACAAALHDAYRATGPDGQPYATWHPPSDPGTGCSFGHEHGADPTSAPALRGRSVPFGYAAAKAGMTEPHTGYKVMRWDNVPFNPRYPDQEHASYLVVIHMGSYGLGRLSQTMHSVQDDFYDPDNGRESHVLILAPFCTLQIALGANDPMPLYAANQCAPTPAGSTIRSLPRWESFAAPNVPYEVWNGQLNVANNGTQWLMQTSVQLATFNGGTFGALVNGQPVLGYSQSSVNAGSPVLTEGAADTATSSAYKGNHREAYLNPHIYASNTSKPSTVWTTPYGILAASQTSHASSDIPQYICQLTVGDASDSAVFGEDYYGTSETKNPN